MEPRTQMTDENQEVALTEEQELAEVLKGYNGPSHANNAPDVEVKADQPAEEATEVQAEEQPAEPSLEDELRELKEKVKSMAESSDPAAVRKMYGEIGNINRTLQQLQTASKAETAPAEKAAALVLKRLSNEYPELAEPLAEDITEVIQNAITQVRPDVNIDERVDAKVAEIRKRDAIEQLADEHPDFETVRETPAFKAWIETKDAAYRDRFMTTWNPAIVSKGLTEFKAYQSAQTTSRERKQNRLAAAVTPQGTNQPGRASTIPDDEGAFIGYNKHRKR